MKHIIIVFSLLLSFSISAQSDSFSNIDNRVKEKKIISKDKEYKNLLQEINKVFFIDDYYLEDFVKKKNYFVNFEYKKDQKSLTSSENNILYFDIITRSMRVDSIEQCYYCDKFLVLKNLYNTIKKYDSLLDKPFDSVLVTNAILKLEKIEKLPEENAKLNTQSNELMILLQNYRMISQSLKLSLIFIQNNSPTKYNQESMNLLTNDIIKFFPVNETKGYFKDKFVSYRFLYSQIEAFKNNQKAFDTNILIQE